MYKNQITFKLSIFVFILFVYSCQNNKNENTKVDLDKSEKIVKYEKFKLKKAKQIITAKENKEKFKEIDNSEITNTNFNNEHQITVFVNPHKKFQTIEGFGGALTDAAAETFYKLSKDKQKEFLKAYFDKKTGIGYNLFRTHINSCDFSSESYAYGDTKDDTALTNFSIEHDKKFRIPFIKEVQALVGDEFKMFASPWSPPAWMKTNNDMLHGGKLKPEYFQTWANYYVRFFDEYKKQGINFWGLTVQNEPLATQIWESCIYTAEEEKDFVKNFLGPTLAKSAFKDTKIIIWDHNRGPMVQRAMTAFDDPEAGKYIWGTGFHWYVEDNFDNVKLVHEAYPDKKLLFTEGCLYPFDYSRLSEWHWGEEYAKSIIHDLNNSVVGWTDWNILLDEKGGPNHVGNYCYAPVIANTKTNELIYMISYYYLGHFSKYIRPGAQRVLCSSTTDKILATAFINKDSSIAVVALNTQDEDHDFNIIIDHQKISCSLPKHSINTVLINK